MSIYRMWLKNQYTILNYIMHRVENALEDHEATDAVKLKEIRHWVDFYNKSNAPHDAMKKTEDYDG